MTGVAHVAICVITYQRPEPLRDLLRSMARLDLEGIVIDRVVVVDNDAAGSAGPVVHACQDELPWPVVHEVEPQKGIATARNRSVALAAGSELLAFVDDDETVDPGWLRELVRVLRATGADMVGGPVFPVFEVEPTGLVRRGGFFDRRRYADGSPVRQLASNNLLVRATVVERLGPLFDPRFDLSGGSDTFLSLRARRAGCRMVWADEAVVREVVPSERARLSWLLRRSFRVGNTDTRCALAAAEGSVRRLRLIEARTGAKMLVRHLALAAAALVRRDLVTAFERLRWAVRGAGMVAAASGVTYFEYGRPRVAPPTP